MPSFLSAALTISPPPPYVHHACWWRVLRPNGRPEPKPSVMSLAVWKPSRVWAHSTAPLETTSSACRLVASSPAEYAWIWNLLSVASATKRHSICPAPKSVSCDLVKLDVIRHLISGADWAMAGAATAGAATAAAAVLARRNALRCTVTPPQIGPWSLAYPRWHDHDTCNFA